MTTHIKVRSIGFWDKPVTVQSGYMEDGEFILENCNHAGATEEWLTQDAGLDGEHEVKTLVCNKCDKQLNEWTGDWV
jgi:uncharacterized membrane protein YcaP (DUF421 family)